ncbi:fimbrial protein [Proteus sp. G2669]|uniref:fimbrial protein n=1 Tax=Proteus sp. G2669 TaxID=2698881 RepID=UPI001413772F|nr:fimbrial protein [Proteus sp. G2669]NBM54476.1 fimbrial protein [Proteus sp. G2669]
MTILIRFFILITSVIISFPLLAGDTVTVNFSGNIRAATCNISGGSNINIDLKEMPANLFKTTNSSSVWNNFTIKLIDCSPTINQVKLTFTGTPDNADVDNLYKNEGTAKNIAVQLQNENSNGLIPLGNQKSLYIAVNGQSSVNIPLRTRAFSKLGNATPGTVSAKITATIVYR